MAIVCILTYPLTLMLSAQMIEKVLAHHFPSCVEEEDKKPYISISDQISPIEKNSYQSIVMDGKSSIVSKNDDNVGIELDYGEHEHKDHLECTGKISMREYVSYIDVNDDNNESTFRYTMSGFHSSPGRSFQVGISTSSKQYDSSYHVDEDEDDIPNSLRPNLATRCLNRLVLVGFTLFIAMTVPCFALVISFLGCCTVSILTYIMPPYIHSKIVTRNLLKKNPDVVNLPLFENDLINPKVQSILDTSYCCFGIVFCVVSTVLTGLSLYETLVEGGTC